MHGEAVVLTFLILGFILDHIFGHKKDNPFCPVFVFRSMSNAICDLEFYFYLFNLFTLFKIGTILVVTNKIQPTNLNIYIHTLNKT